MQHIVGVRSRFLIFTLLIVFTLLTATTASAETLVFTGYIATGDQYDLYQVFLTANTQVTATLVCDEYLAPGNRPLDPVLSVFDPNTDPNEIFFATYFNDDGFGSDDFPNGVDCNFFDSSIITFVVEVEGWYTFRAEGFGSSTGPYILTITHLALGHAFTDGRINPHNQATAIVYCSGNNADIYNPSGTLLMTITPDEASAAANGAVIETAGGVTVSKTADGRLSVLAPLPDGKGYLFIWNGCPVTSSETYTIEGGVGILFETRSY